MEKKTNAIELWAEEFSKMPIRKLTEDEAREFLRYMYAEMKNLVDEAELQKILEEKKGGLASVFWLRVKHCHTFEITVTVAAYFGEIIFKNFAMSTMLANYMQYWAHKKHVAKISMAEVSRMFPMGIPTEESWRNAWKLQKVCTDSTHGFTSDNGLDYPQLMETIKEIEL